jgi:hypothetical protein
MHPGARIRSRDPVRRRLGRVLSDVSGGVSSSADTHAFTDALAAIQQPVTTCRRILVGAVRGGAGATTLTTLLASAYTQYRADGALTLETSRGHGSLAFRLGTARHFDTEEIQSLSRMEPRAAATMLALHHHQPGLVIRPGPMDLDTYRARSAILMRFFGLAIIDAGHDAVVVPGHLDTPHALVLAVPATHDGIRTAMAWYAETAPDLTRRTLAVLVEHSPDGLLSRQALQTLRAVGADTHLVGYDRSLAPGAPLQPSRLARRTTHAAVRIAAAALGIANNATTG